MKKNYINSYLEDVACPLCKRDTYTILQKSNYPSGLNESDVLKLYSASSDHKLYDQLVECDTCKLIYLNPRVNKSLIMESYKNAIDPLFVTQNKQRINTFKKSLGWISKKIKFRNPSDIKILDVGCAGGAFPKAASDLGYDVIGVEPSEWLSRMARDTYNLNVKTGTISDFKWNEKEFNCVTLWDVIEHLTDPNGVLRQINKLLRDDGYLIINYPNYSSLARRLLGFNWPFFLSVHLYYFTPKTMNDILKNNGFEPVAMKAYWQKLELGYVLDRAGSYFHLFNYLAKFVRSIKIDKISIGYNMGQTLVIAAKIK